MRPVLVLTAFVAVASALSKWDMRNENRYLLQRDNEQVDEPDFEIAPEPDEKVKRENEQVDEPDFEIAPEPDE